MFYSFSIRFYALVIRLLSPFNPKAKKWITGRQNIWNKLPDTQNREVIWFHCASLGEFDQGLPLMEIIKKKNPNVFLLVTFFSPSGMDNYHKRNHPADFVMYLPIDTPQNAKKFTSYFKISKAFFVKYEFWSNYINQLHQQQSEIYNISGIFRPNHRFFKFWGASFRKTLRKFDHFFVQNNESEQLLKSIGITNCTITGDSRYDRVTEHKALAKPIVQIEQFKEGKPTLILGSCWPKGEKIISEWQKNWDGKIIIAPHDISESHIKAILNLFPTAKRFTKSESTQSDILILDTIGLLTSAYQYADIAYIGGGFTGSLHNILEPAVYGIPVLFGPKHSRFPEAQLFIDNKVGFSITDTATFNQSLALAIKNKTEIAKKLTSIFSLKTGSSLTIYHKTFE